jgi:hypothetical protein
MLDKVLTITMFILKIMEMILVGDIILVIDLLFHLK